MAAKLLDHFYLALRGGEEKTIKVTRLSTEDLAIMASYAVVGNTDFKGFVDYTTKYTVPFHSPADPEALLDQEDDYQYILSSRKDHDEDAEEN